MDFNVLKNLVNQSSNIVFFGGAGVSTESSIPDFRSFNGLFEGRKDNQKYSSSPEEILCHSFFREQPEQFFSFYKNYMIYQNAEPNEAHKALVKLEERNQLKAIITQNIDGLHQKAGSKNVIELHGSVEHNTCIRCGRTFELDFILKSKQMVPFCDFCQGIVKPNVILYEEELDSNILEQAIHYISIAEILIVAGTSLTVYPAANLIKNYRGNHFILVNENPTKYDGIANYIISDRIGKVMKSLIS